MPSLRWPGAKSAFKPPGQCGQYDGFRPFAGISPVLYLASHGSVHAPGKKHLGCDMHDRTPLHAEATRGPLDSSRIYPREYRPRLLHTSSVNGLRRWSLDADDCWSLCSNARYGRRCRDGLHPVVFAARTRSLVNRPRRITRLHLTS